jgi:uncharacterized membrane-anchored protein YitT (DUF2179 family)
MFFKKNNEENIVKNVYKKYRLKRYIEFLIGVFLVAISFNFVMLPMKITYGFSGVAVILNVVFGFNPPLVIFISSIIILLMSFVLLGKDKTQNSVVGSLLYPVFVVLTEPLLNVFEIPMDEPLLIVLYGAVLSGFGIGLIFKAGFTTGGTDIFNQILSKYFKMSIGKAMLITNGIIIFSGLIVFNYLVVMYSILTLYIVSILTDKVILGISESKMFYIITEHETAVKKFILQHLSHGVTVLEASGGFTGNRKKVIMCIIPTKEYFLAKEGIHSIDPDAFFVVADAYEVSGGE